MENESTADREIARLTAALTRIELRLRLFAAPEVSKSYIEKTRKIAEGALKGGEKGGAK